MQIFPPFFFFFVIQWLLIFPIKVNPLYVSGLFRGGSNIYLVVRVSASAQAQIRRDECCHLGEILLRDNDATVPAESVDEATPESR